MAVERVFAIGRSVHVRARTCASEAACTGAPWCRGGCIAATSGGWPIQRFAVLMRPASAITTDELGLLAHGREPVMPQPAAVTDRTALGQVLRQLKLSGMLQTLDARLVQAAAGDLGHLCVGAYPAKNWLGTLLQLDLPVGLALRGTRRWSGLRRLKRDVAFGCQLVGAFDGAQAGGDPGFAGGDGVAVLSAVGAFGEGLAVAFDFADVGFSFVGVGGDGVHGGVGGGGVEDEADGAGLGVAAGEGEDLGAVGFRPGLLGGGVALPGPVAECGQHDVGSVDLVAGGAEVRADRLDVRAPLGAVAQELGGLRLVRVAGGAGVDSQVCFEGLADAAGFGEVDQAAGEVSVLRPGGQPFLRPVITEFPRSWLVPVLPDVLLPGGDDAPGSFVGPVAGAVHE